MVWDILASVEDGFVLVQLFPNQNVRILHTFVVSVGNWYPCDVGSVRSGSFKIKRDGSVSLRIINCYWIARAMKMDDDV